jgi:flavin-dependent dehydrogenase
MNGWDVAVVGGGPAGAVAGLVCARLGYRVALFDDGGRAMPKVGESLPAAARLLLRALDLEEALDGHLPSHGNAVAWGSPMLETTDAVRDPYGHGWHLDRVRFDAFLVRRALDAGATAIRERVVGCREVDGGVELTVGARIHFARQVIDATGRRAAIARMLGAVRSRDDDLVALCTWVRGAGQDSRTLLETSPAGWWYTAALPDGTRSVVLHTDTCFAARLRDPRRWRALLRCTNHMQPLLGDAELAGEPRGTEACGARLDRFAGAHWIAVGDAACAFDPVASQGIFFALHSGMRAAEALDGTRSGNAGPIAAYCTRVERIRAAYRSRHRFAYAAETRWPTADFWSRRHLRGAEALGRLPSEHEIAGFRSGT